MFEASAFHSLWCLAAQRKGMVIKMKIERCEKESFVIIGKEGSSLDGAGFIHKLWDEAKFNIWLSKMRMDRSVVYGGCYV